MGVLDKSVDVESATGLCKHLSGMTVKECIQVSAISDFHNFPFVV